MTTATHRRPPPTGPEFLREVVAVAADIPRFAAAPFHRRQHQRWGASDTEVSAPMPGDDLVPKAQFQCTRAVMIHAPRVLVWPWLVQVGCLPRRVLRRRSARQPGTPESSIDSPGVPDAQDRPMGADGSRPHGDHRLHGCRLPNRWPLWTQPTSTWAWRLSQGPDSTTRLVTRLRIFYDWNRPAAALFSLLLRSSATSTSCGGCCSGSKNAPRPCYDQGNDQSQGGPDPGSATGSDTGSDRPRASPAAHRKGAGSPRDLHFDLWAGRRRVHGDAPLTTMPLRYLEGSRPTPGAGPAWRCSSLSESARRWCGSDASAHAGSDARPPLRRSWTRNVDPARGGLDRRVPAAADHRGPDRSGACRSPAFDRGACRLIQRSRSRSSGRDGSVWRKPRSQRVASECSQLHSQD